MISFRIANNFSTQNNLRYKAKLAIMALVHSGVVLDIDFEIKLSEKSLFVSWVINGIQWNLDCGYYLFTLVD